MVAELAERAGVRGGPVALRAQRGGREGERGQSAEQGREHESDCISAEAARDALKARAPASVRWRRCARAGRVRMDAITVERQAGRAH